MNSKQQHALLGGIWARVAPFWAHDLRGALNTAAIHLELIQASAGPETPSGSEIGEGVREIRTAIDAVTASLEEMERVAAAGGPRGKGTRERGGFAAEWDAAMNLAAIFARKRGRPLAVTLDPFTGTLAAGNDAGSPTLPLLHLLFDLIDFARPDTEVTVVGRDEPDRYSMNCTWQEADAGETGGKIDIASLQDAFAAGGWSVTPGSAEPARSLAIILEKGGNA